VDALVIGLSWRRYFVAMLLFAGRAILLASTALTAAAAESRLEGLWQTPGEMSAILRFTEMKGEYRGVVDSIPGAEDEDLRCTACTGARRNQPLLNMELVWGLKHVGGGEYTGGSALDPDTGGIYRCSVTIAENGRQLRIRYHLDPRHKSVTEVWTRQTPRAAETRANTTSRKIARTSRR
jgi:uncharacterized protein (DUF2147 family)